MSTWRWQEWGDRQLGPRCLPMALRQEPGAGRRLRGRVSEQEGTDSSWELLESEGQGLNSCNRPPCCVQVPRKVSSCQAGSWSLVIPSCGPTTSRKGGIRPNKSAGEEGLETKSLVGGHTKALCLNDQPGQPHHCQQQVNLVPP